MNVLIIFSANLFIVGGGSNLSNLEKYCTSFFGSNTKKLRRNGKKESEYKLNENFISCLGALKIIKDGWETEAIPVMGKKSAEKKGFFAKLFGINQ